MRVENVTDKHRERINNLIDSLDDYMYNTEFKMIDVEISEYNAIITLRRRLKSRLENEGGFVQA